MKQNLIYSYRNINGRAHIPERLFEVRSRLFEIAAKRSGAYDTHEHVVRLPRDPAVLVEVERALAKVYSTNLRYIIVVGIGGSNLGAQAIYDALRRERDGVHESFPEIIFLDTVSTRLFADVERVLELEVSYPEEVAVNLISKSGGTTESLACFEFIYAYLAKRFANARDRVVVTTDHGSPLWKLAEKKGFTLLPIPKMVGGRYSIFSTVGLFPLALSGVDVREFVHGAEHFIEANRSGEDQALRLAESLYRAHRAGVCTANFFFFNPELESLGKWVRQLYGESLGKERDRAGKIVLAGITPIVSIGSTDLHSMAQLYLGGPRDKFTLFSFVPVASKFHVPKDGTFVDLNPGIKGRSPEEIMEAIYRGTLAAYDAHNLSYGEVTLPDVSAFSLGMFMQWQMFAVIYLAELMHVDPFDQPNVEDYKKVTKELLSLKKH